MIEAPDLVGLTRFLTPLLYVSTVLGVRLLLSPLLLSTSGQPDRHGVLRSALWFPLSIGLGLAVVVAVQRLSHLGARSMGRLLGTTLLLSGVFGLLFFLRRGFLLRPAFAVATCLVVLGLLLSAYVLGANKGRPYGVAIWLLFAAMTIHALVLGLTDLEMLVAAALFSLPDLLLGAVAVSIYAFWRRIGRFRAIRSSGPVQGADALSFGREHTDNA